MVEGVRRRADPGQDAPTDGRRLELEDLHAALDARRERLVTVSLDRRLVGDGAHVGGGHVAHG